MKKILIVNNNMKIGGVQKSLCNLLWSVYDQYDITLFLFKPIGEYMKDIPEQVHVLSCGSLFRYLGISQKECSDHLGDYFTRGILAGICRLLGRKAIMPLLLRTQEQLPVHYDCAISYLHNGAPRRFYGGCNEFILKKVNADRKIAFLHCDYLRCGANCDANNADYAAFDAIAACSDGCRDSFVKAMPMLAEKCQTVPNFHRYDKIKALAAQTPYTFDSETLNIVTVGRLAHEKGLERAIRAIEHARRQGIPAILHLVGSGPKENELRNLADELGLQGAVVFHGSQSNPYGFMCNADLLLITSYHEAAPMIIDEAYCLGLPVLSTDTTSAKEMILDRDCGWVCGNDQDSLNKALAAVLKDVDNIRRMKEQLFQGCPDNGRASRAFYRLIGEKI